MDDPETGSHVVAVASGLGILMQPRQIVRTTSFGPDELRVIYKAYDDAWGEIAPKIGADPVSIETARMALATIVLTLATTDALAAGGLRAIAVMMFRAKYRIETDRAG